VYNCGFESHVFHLAPGLHLLQSPDHLVFRVPARQHTLFPFLSSKSYSVLCRNRGTGQCRYGTAGWLPDVTTFYYRLAIVCRGGWAYLQAMTNRNESPESSTKTSHLHCPVATTLLRSMLCTVFAVMALVTISTAGELPEAPSSVMRSNVSMIEAVTPALAPKVAEVNPEVKAIDKTFVSLAVISTGSTFADSYTTLFARENWLAGKKGVCNVEVQSAYLYGTHPTVGRAYAVASAKGAGAILAAYYLRKHHNRFWSAPLVANSILSLQGVTQNMMTCN
jgi:hypothetical protein